MTRGRLWAPLDHFNCQLTRTEYRTIGSYLSFTTSIMPGLPDPNDPLEQQPTIGIIGMGAMGKMYANEFARTGWKK